jgi:hypothetical protein
LTLTFGAQEAPFFGIWFCGGFGADNERDKAMAALEKRAFRKTSQGKRDAKICSAENTTATTDTRDKRLVSFTTLLGLF